jgi:addiction module RelE/StbE family toxin
MQIVFHRKWDKAYENLDADIQEKVDKRIQLFRKNPHHQLLQNHKLKGEWGGHCSINITGDVRAIYEPIDDGIVHFVAVGTHSELYG